ncbi:hypothetical protein TNCV_4764111 [Trichonephila clavipes]|nr:hypothetical protein TNCV_4764111 [Trichonephila clavipes]
MTENGSNQEISPTERGGRDESHPLERGGRVGTGMPSLPVRERDARLNSFSIFDHDLKLSGEEAWRGEGRAGTGMPSLPVRERDARLNSFSIFDHDLKLSGEEAKRNSTIEIQALQILFPCYLATNITIIQQCIIF